MTIHIEIPKDDLRLAIQDASLIPKKTAGIYKFFGDNDQLLYIGKAKGLRERVLQHLSGKDGTSQDIYHNFKNIACIFVEDPFDREIYETYMINTLQPLLNWEKVITYESQKYNPLYNQKAQQRDEELQARLDKAILNFRI